jgi:hypothetical protein
MRRKDMTMKKYVKVMSLVIISAFVASLVFAQEKTTTKDDGIVKKADGSYRSKDYDESTRPEDDYLAKFHALEVVEDLIKRNMDELQLIQVIVLNNSGKADWNTKYQELNNGYKDGLEQYYKRNLIYARDKLDKNQGGIRELFKLVIADYTKQVEDILNEAAGKVLQLHMDPATRVNPDKQEQLQTNHIRLRVAYGQLDDSQKATSEKYLPGAVYHLRVAKAYGIAILESLSKDENEKKGVHDKYKVVKADNLNRVYAEKKEETKK